MVLEGVRLPLYHLTIKINIMQDKNLLLMLISEALNEFNTHHEIIKIAEDHGGLSEFDGQELASRIEAFIIQEIEELNHERNEN